MRLPLKVQLGFAAVERVEPEALLKEPPAFDVLLKSKLELLVMEITPPLAFVTSPFMTHDVMLFAVTVPLLVKVPSTVIVRVPVPTVMMPLFVRL